MLADYHIHTKMCGHAEGEMEQYVEQAKVAGLSELGFSDHIPMYFLPPAERVPGVAMAEEDLAAYVKKVVELQEENYPYPIKLGIEADFSPMHQKQLTDLLTAHPFDYVIGSIHFIDGWGFDNPEFLDEWANRSVEVVYDQYFALLEQAAASGHFDILAHADLVKKFGFRPQKDITYIFDKLAKVVADAGMCVEVNTAGLRVPVKEIYPAPEFLKACLKYKVPVTLGSDAHHPDLVAKDFVQALELLKNVGYHEIAVFKQRKRGVLSL